jgi:hypothetical protein
MMKLYLHSSWHGAWLIKDRNDFTFYITLLIYFSFIDEN